MFLCKRKGMDEGQRKLSTCESILVSEYGDQLTRIGKIMLLFANYFSIYCVIHLFRMK